MDSKRTYRTVTDELFGEQPAMAPGQQEAATQRQKEFVATLDSSDAFEMSLEDASRMLKEEKAELKGKIGLCAAVFVVLFLVSLCIEPTLGGGFMSPLRALDGVAAHFEVLFSSIVGQSSDLNYAQILEQHPGYYMVETRFANAIVVSLAGVLLAVAGSLYQTVFKNPIAAPTMLGVSNGVSLGILIFVLVFQQAALNMEGVRYAFSYAGAAIVLLLVLGLTKLICGKVRAFSVFELLLVGSIFSQVCGGITQAITDTVMTDELWEVYQQISEYSAAYLGTVGVIVLIVVAVVTLVPVFAARYAINTISYSDLEAKLIGLDTNKIKVACLVCGTVMVTAAQISVGTVSMIALVVPFISRSLFGVEFKHQLWGDILIGAVLLLLCRDLVLLFPFFNMELTLGSVVSFVTLPVYVWIIASKQRSWN